MKKRLKNGTIAIQYPPPILFTFISQLSDLVTRVGKTCQNIQIINNNPLLTLTSPLTSDRPVTKSSPDRISGDKSRWEVLWEADRTVELINKEIGRLLTATLLKPSRRTAAFTSHISLHWSYILHCAPLPENSF